MSEWLARARQQRLLEENPAPKECAKTAKTAKTPFGSLSEDGFGSFGTTSSIPLEEIRDRFDWTALRLREEHGLAPALAHGRAVAVLRSELHNDPRLVPVQQDPRTCLVCGRPANLARILAAILSPHPDERLWLHLEPCHAEYLQHQATRVDTLLAGAGLEEM
jgi:hypothetical protein